MFEGMFSEVRRGIEFLQDDIENVRWAPLKFGNAIEFEFRKKPYMGFLRGRNADLIVVGDGSDCVTDRSMSIRVLFDGDAIPSKGRKKHLLRYVEQRYCCAICRKPFPIAEMTRDHIVPRSKNGGRDWDNIQLTCETCNHQKADRDISPLFFLEKSCE